jgi:hypothetical protein
MSKSLKDILQGIKASKVTPIDLGGYAPKELDSKKWVSKHSIEKHEDRVGNGDDVYKGKTETDYNKNFSNKRLGRKKGEDEKVYEENIDEVLTKKTPVGDVVKDFVDSDNKMFKGDNKKERIKRALGAFYGKHPELKKKTNESLDISENIHTNIPPGHRRILHNLKAGESHIFQNNKGHNISAFRQGNLLYIHNMTTNQIHTVHPNSMHEAFDYNLAMPILGGDTSNYNSVDLVKAELKAISTKSTHLVDTMPENMQIEPWVQAKIATAKELVTSVHDFMIYGDHGKPEEDEQMDTPMTFPGMNVDNALGMNV